MVLHSSKSHHFVLCLLSLLSALSIAQAQDYIVIDGRKASAKGVLARLKDSSNRVKAVEVEKTLTQKSLRQKALTNQGGVRGLMQVEKSSGKALTPALTSLEAQKMVKDLMATGLYEYVEPDWIITVQQVPTDTAFTNGSLWGLRNTGQNGGTLDVDVNAVPAWSLTRGSPNVVVGVIDSGIRYTHQDLASNMWRNTREIAGNMIDDDANGYVDDVFGINGITNSGDPMDDNNHGTHCAGTIAATANNAGQHVGVAYNVRLMALKFLSAAGSGATSDAIKCINYGVANGATILSNSWGGGGYSQSLRDAIAAASQAGVLFIAAAGNSASNNDTAANYPSNYDPPNVVAVAAVSRTGAMASFSSFGLTTVDLGAPGVEILSSTATSDSSYGTFQGTSMATPHVAGVAALVKSLYPTASMLEVKNRLLASTRPLASLNGRTVTGGMVDAHAALTVAADGVLEVRAAAGNNALTAGSNMPFYISVSDLLPISGATVTGILGAGTSVVFLDDGVSPDLTANDATYSATMLVPSVGSSVALNILASATGMTSASRTFNFQIITPPVNDMFANRLVLSSGTTQARGTNRLATREVGESLNPSPAGGSTVWWEWVAGFSGSVTITTSGSSYDTTMAVYSGAASLSGLSLLASNDDSTSLTSSVTFAAVNGQRYFVQVDGFLNSTGDVVLNYPSPLNANSPPAIAIQPVSRLLVIGDLLNLNVVANGSLPLTYQWFFENAAISNARSSAYNITAVQKIHEGNYSVVITNPFGSITSAVVFVGVDPISVRPINDSFADAARLPGARGRVSGSNQRASAELGEPDHAAASSPIESVWYRWTAPAAGTLSMNTYGSSLDTTLASYTGTSVSALTLLSANNDAGGLQSFISMPVAAGQEITFAVDGVASAEGIFTLNYYFQPTLLGLANDEFSNRSILPGVSGSVTGSNISATGENGEPTHSPLAAPTASVWWEWTAPMNGLAVIDTLGSNFDTTLAIYTGSAVDSLIAITSNDDAGGPQSRVSFNCVAGTSYLVAVDGRGSAEGNITLSLSTGFSAPEISVEQPVGVSLVDGVSNVSFGAVAVGFSRSLSFTIANRGGADLTGLALTMEGDVSGDFSQPTLSVTSLPAGQTTSFTLQFQPGVLGPRSLTLRLTSNDENENPFDIAISGSGALAAPEISVETVEGVALTSGVSTVSLGSVARGLPRTKTYVIRNTGLAPLTGISAALSGLQATDYSFIAQPAPSVQPGGSTSFVVSFVPSVIGVRSATLSITSNDLDESLFNTNITARGLTPSDQLGFRIASLNATGSQIVDHNVLTGDDRGGIAISTSRVFVTGDSATAAFNLDDLSNGAAIGRVSNGLCSDLATNRAYILANNGLEVSSGGTVNQLIALDPNTGALTSTIITLSQAVVMSYGSGIFSGFGRIVLYTGSEVYDVRLPSGEVIFHGAMARPSWTSSESWAVWGVAEDFSGYLHLAYASSSTIRRSRVPDGSTEVIASFTNLSDMANWTASLTNNRWYFHHEGSGQFGGASETLGYADATYVSGAPTAAPEITSAAVATANVGAAFNFGIIATNQPTIYSATALPAGLVVDPSTGRIIGTATTEGVFNCVLTARNSFGTGSSNCTITVTRPLQSFEDDFDPDINRPIWGEFGGTVVANTIGQQAGSGSTGNSLHFSGVGSRFATTTPLDVRSLSAVSFKCALSNGSSSSWEGTDPGEEVVLEYSIDGVTFTRFGGPYYNRAWSRYVTAIPAQARTVATVFRWRQLASSGPNFDQWAIEDVSINNNIIIESEISVHSPLGNELRAGVSVVDFGNVGASATASRTFTLRNDGGANLTGLGVSLVGADASSFRIQAPLPNSLASAAAVDLTVLFSPTSSGQKQLILRITSNDADESNFDLSLTGRGVVFQAEIIVEQPPGTSLTDGVSAIDFGSVLPTRTVSKSFTIRNIGLDPLTPINVNVVGANASDFSLTSLPLTSVSSNGSTTFTLSYTPDAVGPHSAVLLITSNDVDENPFEVLLSGTGLAPSAYISIFSNPGYTSIVTGSPYQRMIQLLEAENYVVRSFTGLAEEDWRIAFEADAVMIPPLTGAAIPLDLATCAMIRQQASAGKGLVVLGATSGFGTPDADFLNSIHGWTLAENYDDRLSSIERSLPVSRIPNSPFLLTPRMSSRQKFKDSSLPQTAQRIYGNGKSTLAFYKGSTAFLMNHLVIDSGDFDDFFPDLTSLILRNGRVADLKIEFPDVYRQPDLGAVMNLGSSPVGIGSTYTLRMTNTGTQPLTNLRVIMTGTNASDFSLVTPLPVRIMEGETFTLGVRMKPAAFGSRVATLNLLSNAYLTPNFAIQLSGTGQLGVPEFYMLPIRNQISNEAVNRTPVFFNAFPGSTFSPSMSFNIGNLGTAPLGVRSIEITGASAREFSLQNRSPLSLQIQPNNFMSFSVVYHGYATDPAVAQLRIISNDGDEGVFDVMLINGFQSMPKVFVRNDTERRFLLNYGLIDLGKLTLGESITRKFTVGNHGGLSLTKISLSKAGPQAGDFIVTPLSASSLYPGTSQSFTLTFTPKNGGLRIASLKLASNSGVDNPMVINFIASVDAAEISVTDSSDSSLVIIDGKTTLPFGVNMASGQIQTRNLTVSNLGSRILKFGEAVIDGPQARAFTVTGFDSGDLEPERSVPLALRFQGALPGTYNATLHLVSSDVDESPYDIKLTAHVSEPDISLELVSNRPLISNVDSIEFSDARVTALITRTLTVRNLGNAPLSLTGLSLSGPGVASYSLGDFSTQMLAPKASVKISVNHVLSDMRATQAELRISSNDPDEGIFSLALVGIGSTEYAPQLVSQPLDQIVYLGRPVTLESDFKAHLTNTYQWSKGPMPLTKIRGANMSRLTLRAASLADGIFQYFVSAVNTRGVAQSQSVALTVVDPATGFWNLARGENKIMSVSATSSGALSYRWMKNAIPIIEDTRYMGVESAQLSITDLQINDSATYSCEVSGPGGALISGAQNLTVYDAAPQFASDPLILPATGLAQDYSYRVPLMAQNGAATSFTAKNLPRGLAINAVTGEITGRATQTSPSPEPFRFSITATNNLASSTASAEIQISSLPNLVPGTYAALIARGSLNAELGGRLDFAITTSGRLTGKLLSGKKAYTLPASLITCLPTTEQIRIDLLIPRKSQSTLRLTLRMSYATGMQFQSGAITGLDVVDCPVLSCRTRLLVGDSLLPAYAGFHTLALSIPAALIGAATIPQGFSYAVYTVPTKGGSFSFVGRMADGDAFTTSCLLTRGGLCSLYGLLPGGGSLHGEITLPPSFQQMTQGDVTWSRPSSASASYPDGLGPLSLGLAGGRYMPPQSGQIVLGKPVPATVGNGSLIFRHAGLLGPISIVDRLVDLTPAASLSFLPIGPVGTTLKVNATTGSYSGRFNFNDAHPYIPGAPRILRVAAFQGVIVQTPAGQIGRGFFLLRQLPRPIFPQPRIQPSLSGSVIFQ